MPVARVQPLPLDFALEPVLERAQLHASPIEMVVRCIRRRYLLPS
jgi:hypothetical protein